MKNTTSRKPSSILTAVSGFAGRIARSILALALFVALSCGMAPTTVRANAFKTLYVPGDSYVQYDSNHIPDPNGTLQDASPTTTDGDGHVYDFYGNQLVYNADGSISDVSDEVVGFVYQSAGGPGQIFP